MPLWFVALCFRGFLFTSLYQTYRCWIVYKKRWSIIVLPVILILYNFSVIITVSYWNSLKAAQTRTSLFTLITQWKRVLVVQEGYLFATIVVNLYTTCKLDDVYSIGMLNYISAAIIIQIFRKKIPHRRNPTLSFTIRVIAESGLLYTITGIAVLVATFVSLSPNGSQLPLIIFGAIVCHTSIGNAYHRDLFIASSIILSPESRMISY